ncbi:MAG: 3-oxoacyl-[acyl-carrier-protein] synthase 2 [Phycisphaerae bacterium]|nr:3-oxoacyl-[acyl-carrier-protein] synthase 2 [Phycisphaerae bacterium]
MSARRVAITGLGPVSPLGVGAAEFWNALLDGRNAVRELASFNPARFESRVGAEIESCNIQDAVPKAYRKAGKIMARDIVLAVVAAHKAVSDAGLVTRCLLERGDHPGPCNLDSARFGANIGAGLICADLPELAEALANARDGEQFSLARWGAEGMNNLTPLWLLKFLPNMLACHVTIVHDAQGPSNTITCGEASSQLAIGEAFRTIQRGVADVCICGGAESKANPMALLRQSLAGRLSRRNDSPATACRPFGRERDGTVVSEGGGLVILEELEHARRRGARIYAELVGFGASNDAAPPAQPTTPPADGRGVLLAARKALRDAQVGAEQLDLVSAFAAGLPQHDASEAAATRALLGGKYGQTPVLAIKGGLGNNGAGSGALDFIAMVLATANGTLPPMVNGELADPALAPKVVTGKAVDANIGCALALSYALGGGQNAALVVRRLRD